MTRRPIALQLVLLTTVVVLIALSLAAPACTPSSPARQSTGGGLTPTHTQTTTNTPKPASTFPVTPDLSKLGVNTAAIVGFLAMPTPEAAPGGEGVDSVGSKGSSNQDMSLAARSGNAVNGATGADTEPAFPSIRLPSLITVSISTLDMESTQSFLEANGGNVTENSLINTPPSWTFVAEMPPSLLPSLSQRPDLLHAYVDKVYEKVHSDISQLVIEYAVAQSIDPALLPESGGIKVVIEATPEGYANVRLLLERYEVPLTYPDFGDLGSFDGTQIIPPGLVIPVSELTGVTYVNLPPIEVEKILPESQHLEFQSQPHRRAAQVHGARSWHTAGIDGAGVRV